MELGGKGVFFYISIFLIAPGNWGLRCSLERENKEMILRNSEG